MKKCPHCNTLHEDYEGDVNPNIQKFWGRESDRWHKSKFAKHPIFGMYGNELSKAAYKNVEDADVDPARIMEIFSRIMRIERSNTEELENLAIHIVGEIWGLDDISFLHAELTKDVDSEMEGPDGDEIEEEPPEKEPDDELSPDDVKNINHRITMNALSHGAGVHHMKTSHHVSKKATKALQRIDPSLVDAYSSFGKGSHKMYWMQDFAAMLEAMMQMGGLAGGGGLSAQIGSSRIEWGEGEDTQPQVIAKAWLFPVLIQELSKGIMEILTTHGYSKHDERTQHLLQKHADKYEDEPWLIQLGPEIWQRFVKVAHGIDLPSLVSELSAADTDEVSRLISTVIEVTKIEADETPEEKEERMMRTEEVREKLQRLAGGGEDVEDIEQELAGL